MDDAQLESFYVSDQPDINQLAQDFESDAADMFTFTERCRRGYDQRHCDWPGKSADLRKHGSGAVPWEGASDIEIPLIEEAVSSYVSLCMTALDGATIRALPREVSDARRAPMVAMFLKYMRDSYIPSFRREMETCAESLFEKGLAVCHVDWEEFTRDTVEYFRVSDYDEGNPMFAQMLLDERQEDDFIALLEEQFEHIDKGAVRQALKVIREEGEGEVPVSKRDISRPYVRALFPDTEFIAPAYTHRLQDAPRLHVRCLLTPHELESKVTRDGWNASFAGELIENTRGDAFNLLNDRTTSNARLTGQRTLFSSGGSSQEGDDLVEIIYTYRKQFNERGGSQGVYLTVWSNNDQSEYLWHGLLPGYTDYPFCDVRLFESTKRWYDTKSFVDLLRSSQRIVKVTRDSTIDNTSISLAPPLLHPPGRPPSQWGANAFIAKRPNDEYNLMPIPQLGNNGVSLEELYRKDAKGIVGLDPEDPYSTIRQQAYVNKFLHLVQDVLRMSYQCFQVFGPDEVFFRVTGQPDPIRFLRSPSESSADVKITFNVLDTDPETLQARLGLIREIAQQADRRKYDVDLLNSIIISMIDPSIADAITLPEGAGQEQLLRDVMADISQIYAGFPMGARSGGGQSALEIISEYANQPDVRQKLASDPAFSARLSEYAAQYEQQAAQQVNATEYGPLGARAARLGDIETQGIQEGQ